MEYKYLVIFYFYQKPYIYCNNQDSYILLILLIMMMISFSEYFIIFY